jgi:hypothetical protein
MGLQSIATVGTSRVRRQDGIALITTLMVMMLVSVLMIGFVAAIISDNRASGLDRDQTQAYAAAHAGLEKLTSDLSSLFKIDFAPSAAQIATLNAAPPVVSGFQYLAPSGGSGYQITFIAGPGGNPAPADPLGTAISAGPYQGLKGIITPYDITVTARSTGGAEVRMRRTLQTIAVPVFQFGVFSEGDLSFLATADATFSGRIHTNGNLYLAEGNGKTLTLTDRVTAAGEIIRANLSNGFTSSADDKGVVNILMSPGVYRDLTKKEGSLVGDLGTVLNDPTWTTLSIGTYNGNIRNGRTGARRLDLPLVSQGATPIDLIRRPVQNSNENTVNPPVFAQRFFSQAALRILLSDTAADITNLPGLSPGAPVPLDGTATAAQYGPVDATHPPIAVSAGPASTTTTAVTGSGVNVTIPIVDVRPLLSTLKLGVTTVTCTGKTAVSFTGCTVGMPLTVVGTAVSGGGMSTITTAVTTALSTTIPVVSTAGFSPLPFFWDNNITTCTDYTATSLVNCTGVTAATGNLPNNATLTTAALSNAGQPLINGFIKIDQQTSPGVWRDVTTEVLNLGIAAPNQRGTICADPTPNAIVRLQRLRDNGGICNYSPSVKGSDYWPNVLYDAREGNMRDSVNLNSPDMALGGIMNFIAFDVDNYRKWIAGTIPGTGSQSWENNGYIVYFSDRRNNRNAANVETGEYGWEDNINPDDRWGVPDNVLQGGEDINGNGAFDTYGKTPKNLPAGALAPLSAAALPQSVSVGGLPITAPHAMVNRQILFRRALKLVNGASGQLPAGFTVAAENPVYVHGNYNAVAGNTLADPHVPAAILADSITLLSSNWVDVQSLLAPNNPAARVATTTGYRVAMMAGKGPAFTQPAGWGSMRDFGTDGGGENYPRALEAWDGQTLGLRGSLITFFVSRQANGTFKCCENVYHEPIRDIKFDTEFLTPTMLPPGTPTFRDVNTLTFRQLLRPNQ